MINYLCLKNMVRKLRKKKICFVASSGGHFEQLMMLEPLMKRYDSFILTEKTSYEVKVDGLREYYVPQVNRKEKDYLLKMLRNSLFSIYIFVKERPDIVITTGVLAVIPICLIAKLFRKKLVYIESFAKVSSPTKTGQFLYKYADQFYVQWESMLKFYPNAIYLGSIY
ncbi:PssD/Cps14F family polysaccharide biosynthesis glycosyltransferase [Limosilactobacillus mucosae]|uniref:PssD/Cps14F family polysaccharide biosynthesis glycosyltransferase n=1 Tax=Limosilactobacillus mucosae TaxID=97478 RepID=UPI003EBF5C18